MSRWVGESVVFCWPLGLWGSGGFFVGVVCADKLMRVWRTSGDEEWILVHVEVQSQKQVIFPVRMFIYYYRLRDRYNRQVASLAVLGDGQNGWRPD